MRVRLVGPSWGTNPGQSNVGDIVEAWEHPLPGNVWAWQFHDRDGGVYGISKAEGSHWQGELVHDVDEELSEKARDWDLVELGNLIDCFDDSVGRSDVVYALRSLADDVEKGELV